MTSLPWQGEYFIFILFMLLTSSQELLREGLVHAAPNWYRRTIQLLLGHAGPGLYQGTSNSPLCVLAFALTDTLTDLLGQREGQKEGTFLSSINKLLC